MNILNISGLAMNFIGTILIAFYISTDKKEWIANERGQKPREKWYAVYIKHPYWLHAGIIFIAIGFAISIVAEIYKSI